MLGRPLTYTWSTDNNHQLWKARLVRLSKKKHTSEPLQTGTQRNVIIGLIDLPSADLFFWEWLMSQVHICFLLWHSSSLLVLCPLCVAFPGVNAD